MNIGDCQEDLSEFLVKLIDTLQITETQFTEKKEFFSFKNKYSETEVMNTVNLIQDPNSDKPESVLRTITNFTSLKEKFFFKKYLRDFSYIDNDRFTNRIEKGRIYSKSDIKRR